MAAAAEALARHEYLAAEERFDQAAAIAPLDDGEGEQRATAERALEPFAAEVKLFRDGEFEMVLPALWRLRQSDPESVDVRRMIVDSYYNLAVRDLQRGDAKGAAQKLGEAAKLVPDDGEIARHYLFAKSYQDRDKDLLYRIYVKYLPTR